MPLVAENTNVYNYLNNSYNKCHDIYYLIHYYESWCANYECTHQEAKEKKFRRTINKFDTGNSELQTVCGCSDEDELLDMLKNSELFNMEKTEESGKIILKSGVPLGDSYVLKFAELEEKIKHDYSDNKPVELICEYDDTEEGFAENIKQLEDLQLQIGKADQLYYIQGIAFRKIKKLKLFRLTVHKTFEAYCKTVHGVSVDTVDRRIMYADIYETVIAKKRMVYCKILDIKKVGKFHEMLKKLKEVISDKKIKWVWKKAAEDSKSNTVEWEAFETRANAVLRALAGENTEPELESASEAPATENNEPKEQQEPQSNNTPPQELVLGLYSGLPLTIDSETPDKVAYVANKAGEDADTLFKVILDAVKKVDFDENEIRSLKEKYDNLLISLNNGTLRNVS